MKSIFTTIVLALIATITAHAQTQTIRGVLHDEQSGAPLIGANVIVVNSDPFIGASTDMNGKFRLEGVPVGRQTLSISYLGYEDRVMPNLLVTSGKEMVLNFTLRESIEMLDEVVISGKAERGESINEMATVSARTFNVEESKRYAGAIGDPSRMASSYAGVGAVDGNNDLVIRGNSPKGMLWRMEGIEIPNPNHFSDQGASGGPISMLSSNMMTSSEFFTGAFPAEYGNSFSGVFDIFLREGNNEQREYSLGVSVLGSDVSVEGPFSKYSDASYLVNYRYSTLAMFNLIGLDVVGDIIPKYQDVSYNFTFPTDRYGKFNVFGLAGSGSVIDEWREEDYAYEDEYLSQMGVTGVKHTYLVGDKLLFKSVAAVMGSRLYYSQQQIDSVTNETIRDSYDGENIDQAIRISTSANYKFNARHTLKLGAIYNNIGFDYTERYFGEREQALVERLNASGASDRYQSYAQWQYRPTPRLTFNTGVHYTHFVQTGENKVEPRLGAKFQIDEKSNLSAGFGMHSKTWDMSTYHATSYDAMGNTYQPNEQLKMLQSYHYVVGYDRMLTPNIYMKVEAYYQHLDDVPIIDSDTSNYALINDNSGYVTDPLTNNGTGTNYGLELTLERYFTNQFFFMATSSIFNSTYVGGDGVERNTVNNGNYINNVQFGKEWNLGSPKHVIGVSMKGVWAGGRRTTPILMEESREAGHTVRDETRAYETKLPDYIRPDVQIAYRINGKKASHEIKLDVQNAINRENPWWDYYDPVADKVATDYQVGILPVLMYKVQF